MVQIVAEEVHTCFACLKVAIQLIASKHTALKASHTYHLAGKCVVLIVIVVVVVVVVVVKVKGKTVKIKCLQKCKYCSVWCKYLRNYASYFPKGRRNSTFGYFVCLGCNVSKNVCDLLSRGQKLF